MVKIRYFNFI